MIKFYCTNCGKFKNVLIEELTKDDLSGDIICNKCHLIIATYSANKPGVYEMKQKIKLIEWCLSEKGMLWKYYFNQIF